MKCCCPAVPAWLWTASDVLRGLPLPGDSEEEEEEEEFLLPEELLALPVCALDCADGALFYRVLGAWCVPWTDVPLAPFLAAWFALDAETRRALVLETKVFAAELDGDHWSDNLLARDDADMLAALPDDDLLPRHQWQLFATDDGLPFEGKGGVPSASGACILRGAVNCLTVWARLHCWPDGDWSNHTNPNYSFFAAASSSAVACRTAAYNGHLPMLRLLHTNGCHWHELVCSWAASKGHLDCLQYAHEHGCPWDAYTCIWAAECGHLTCLQYAREHGCPWNEKEVRACAAKGAHVACLQYLHECVGGSFAHHMVFE